MSFLDKLLEGVEVEWKPLGEVAEIKTGQAVSKNMISENQGTYPVINSGREPLGFINIWNTNNDPLGITSRGAGVGSITWQEGKYFRGNLNYSISIKDKNQLNVRFLYHLLNEIQMEIHSLCTFQGIPALNASNLKPLLIPIPTIEIQQKIVAILDTFTELTAELTSELTSELTARKSQYTYYREKLLSFDENQVEWKTLGEVLTIKNGKDYKSFKVGDIPVYGSGGVMTYIDTPIFEKPSVLIPRKGSLGNLFYVDFPFWTVDTLFWTDINITVVLPKYVYYYLQTQKLADLNMAGGVPSLTQTILNKVKIPIPPLSEQERIVSILDQFDTLTTSITEGLTKEIELRKKQYEYYRDMLLSFPKN
ncbi:restriction endonuclease subunit S [Cloacibacterium normanense]|nr:restriction endonuclease subunit S [Cloacibacterium normanense]